LCSGIISCYGSRIRDYADLTPACPTLLLFAKEDSFDVNGLISKLQSKKRLSIVEFDAEHGFVDPFSNYFNPHHPRMFKKSKFATLATILIPIIKRGGGLF
jgi:dienelactone hydrolase